MSLLSAGTVTVEAYRVHTGDGSTAASAVSGALIEAQSLLEEELRRLLESTERTETLRVWPDGRVFPTAYPISDAELTIDGRSLLGATPDGGPFVGVFESSTSIVATVTSTGGFTPTDGATPLPVTLSDAIYDLAAARVGFVTPPPAGASSASVGDVSVAYSASTAATGIDRYVAGLSPRVKKYRNRWAG